MQRRQKVSGLVLGNLALAQIRQREIDRAATTLHEAIAATEQTRGGGGFTVIFKAARDLGPWRHEPVVAAVHDRLFALLAAT